MRGRISPNPFDEEVVAASYDSWFADPIGSTADRLEKALIAKMARPRPGERALDVGTGTGHFAIYLADLGLQVVGVDSSAAMLAIARAKRPEIPWHRASVENLPYKDESFALVLSVTTLEFVSDVDLALAEMYRVTRPGGRLVVAVLNRLSPWAQARLEEAQHAVTPFSHAHFFTPDEFAAALRRLGPSRWSSAVFFGPRGQGLALASALEVIGQGLAKRRGALLVGRVDRPREDRG